MCIKHGVFQSRRSKRVTRCPAQAFNFNKRDDFSIVARFRVLIPATFFFFFFSFISLIADGPHHYHPTCGHKGSSHLSPVHALHFFYRDASSALLQLVNQWLICVSNSPIRCCLQFRELGGFTVSGMHLVG